MNGAYKLILDTIPAGATVLDLGCGSGELLKALIAEKGVRGMGVEISEEQIIACIRKGLSVFQGNIEEGLKEYPDKSYDYVILNQTLQDIYRAELVLKEMARVGKRVVVGVPNFAHWRVRAELTFTGRLPSGNRRLVTVRDFKQLCGRLGLSVVQEYYLADDRPLTGFRRLCPGFFCKEALFILK